MRNNRKTLVITLSATFILMALLVVYTTRMIYNTSYSYIHELGDDKTSAISADLENYLENAKSVLWVAADTVDHMVANGATDEEIVDYITRESANTEQQFDESYTGLYGVIRGNYVDGVGWVPPEGYDPTARDWYKTAVEAGGETVIVSPYVDAQTGNVIISIVKMLSDYGNVLSLDLTLSGVQDIIEKTQLNGNGYSFILNNDGMVIAHPDRSLNGSFFDDTEEGKALFDKAISVGKGNFNMNVDGEDCTVFVDEVMSQWHLVIVTNTGVLFKAPRNIMFISALINLCVFALIAVFYFLGDRYEQKMNKRIDEMKEIEQKKDYEAKLLMLEKSAADSANKAKSDFLADMSHEIRTPINAVLGMNEMILHESDDEQILDYASSIKSAGNTLLSIINNILDFSKIEDGKMNLVPVEFSTAELISGLVNSISERARTKNLELIVEVDDTIPSKLFGDDVRISQIIMNLLTNAVKYTEKGSVTLSVRNKGAEDGNVSLRFDVADTGIGIRKEDFDKLFKSFERVEEKRNRHIEGTGLGISIVTRLLAMMDSKLDIKSEYGKGSTFGFDLSLKVVDSDPVGNYDDRKKTVSRGDEVSLSAPSARILVTDDNAMNLKVAGNLMKFFDIKPITCSSGRTTIDMFRNNSFDILFLDHMMPQMDGIETLKILKSEGLLGDTRVIALTANAVVGAREQYLNAGFDDYLSKPIMLGDLERILKTYLPESVVSVSESVQNDDSADASDTELTIGKAESIGLNVSAGVEFSGGDEEFYLEILTDYANDAEEKCNALSKYMKAKDWKNYKILVHSIKSASKTVGASYISEEARKLEEASAREDEEYVVANHNALISDYRTLAGRILG